jgi:hypothetical protein
MQRLRHRVTVLATASVFAGAVLAGCAGIGQDPSTHGPTAAPGGLSRDDAIERARAATPGAGSSTSVVWASIESDPFSPHGSAAPGPLTWVVRLQGGLAPSPCPFGFLDVPPTASSPACLDGDGGIDVVIDYYAGTLLGWSH